MVRNILRQYQRLFGIRRYAYSPVKRLQNKRGFTLLEMMVAVALSSAVAACVYYYVSAFNQMRYEYGTQMELIQQAQTTLDKMVWGYGDPRKGIYDATSLTFTSPTQLDYDDLDGDSHTIRLDDQAVEYSGSNDDPRTYFDPNGEEYDDNAEDTSTDLTFTQIGTKTVQIDLVLGKRVQGRWLYASLSTKVFCRN